MNLIWRTLYTLIFSRFQSKLNLLDIARTRFHVLPTDVDMLLHMNNGRYFSILDLARANFIMRHKNYKRIKREKIFAVVASEMIRFKRSLDLWQKFDVYTQILGWDEKYCYIAHYIKVKNHLHACALIKGRFIQNKTLVSTQYVLDLLGHHQPTPELPAWVHEWMAADHSFYKASLEKKV